MTLFWILTAALTALALAHVLPVLLRSRPAKAALDAAARRASTLAILREQAAQLDAELASGQLDAKQHRAAREDIERRVLEEADAVGPTTKTLATNAPAERPWKSAWLLGLGVPLLVGTIYSRVGSPQAIDAPPPPPVASLGADNVTDAQVEELVTKLATAMEQKPDDLAGWTLLARTYAVLQRYTEASKAYARASALAPNDAQLLADHADVLAMLQGQKISGEPARLVTRALQIDPKNLKALALAGGAAYEAGQYPQAIEYWTLARRLSPPDTPFSENLDRSLVDARRALQGGAPGVPEAPTATADTGAAAQPSPSVPGPAHVAGTVSLSPALAGKAAPGDTVFIFARAAEGPRMPLAILRRTVADLPIQFTLDDAMAMSPAMKLSNFPVVVVGARVSKTGNALPSPGDLSGQASGVKLGAEGLQIVIDTVQP
ncbi:MAG: c-type cytochrome biogenesis protein CcmI [Burkholderiales bacterium PBB1]|nr:MAG: c-type cytochrome biogenesis protein CcmI [Burkholderiales bacterium PBB1]